jgi:hypothetical protein
MEFSASQPMPAIPELSVVAIVRDLSFAEGNLRKGAVGTVVHVFEKTGGQQVLVEFCDKHGAAFLTDTVAITDLMLLYYYPEQALKQPA